MAFLAQFDMIMNGITWIRSGRFRALLLKINSFGGLDIRNMMLCFSYFIDPLYSLLRDVDCRAKHWLSFSPYWSHWLMGHTRQPEGLITAGLQVLLFCCLPES
jgi:hypothetical protein